MERGNEIMARTDKTIAENRDAFKDLRSYLRELTLRHERALDALIEQSVKHTEALEAARHEIAAEVRGTREEIVGELKQHRQALFRILDRLPNGGQGSAAGA
jgi:hypothetical protein